MSREIKFRAWDKSRMSHVNSIDFSNECVELDAHDYRDFVDVVLMQYTGLKDKNGTEIYEDDIVYFPKRYATDWGIVREGNHVADMSWIWMYFEDEFKEVEVIGNIYENPDV